MGPTSSYAAPFTPPQLATSIKTVASSTTDILKNRPEGSKEEEEGENRSTSRGSNNSGFVVEYRQQQQSSYQQQHQYWCNCCGEQQPCDCSTSKPIEKSPNCSDFDLMEEHYNRQTHCSPSIRTNKNAQGDGSFRGGNNDNNNNIGHLYDQQGQNNQFNYQNHHQHSSSQSGQELEISRGDSSLRLSERHQQHLSYSANYPENEECWTLPTLSGNNPLISGASQFSEPAFRNNQTSNSRSEHQQQISYGYGLYSNYNDKIGNFEDINDFNNNNQQQQQLHQQNSVFSSGHHIAPVTLSPVGRDSPYHYQQAHSTSTSQEQVYTTSSNYYSNASDCNETSDYGARHQPQHFQQQDNNAQGHQPMQTVTSLDMHHDLQRQQPAHNLRLIQSQNPLTDRSFQSIRQRQDCSSYGSITTQQQQSNSQQIPLLQEHSNNSDAPIRTQIDNNHCYDDQHIQPHQLYQSHQQQHMVITQNQVTNNDQYPEQGYANLQQPTTNCDTYANRIPATTTTITSPLANDDCSEPIRMSNNNKLRTLKGRRGRPRKKSIRSKNKVNGKLWEFIRDLLLNERTNPSFIRWERREDGVFKFVQSDKVAKMWGERKQNPKMTYEKLSRAMRYYYKSKVLLPVFGRRLVYKFGPNATGWMPETKGNLY